MDWHDNIVNTPDFEFVCEIGDAEFSVLYISYPKEIPIENTKLPHTHTYIELLHIFSGTSVYEDKNGKVVLGDSDTIIEAQDYEHNNIGSEACCANKIGFAMIKKGHAKNSMYSMFYEVFGLIRCEIIKKSDDIGRLCPNIEKYIGKAGNPYRISAAFTELIFYLFDYFTHKYSRIPNKNASVKSSHSSEELINNALLYYYKSDISTADIAGKAHLSQRQVNRICQRMYGKTFNEQKTYYRIMNAKKLLCETDDNVLQIGMECGFTSAGSFYSAFKKAEEMTPKNYRELIGKQKKFY